MSWQQLTFRIPASQLPHAEALLKLAGAASVAIADNSDTPILEPAPGETPLWSDLTVRALFADPVEPERLLALLAPALGEHAELEQISDEEVREAARQTIEPINIGARLRIAPADHAHIDERSVRLNMGLAFGTGRHPTTRLCLDWLDNDMLAPARVLDYGCGSGVLAVAAVKLGAGQALAIDNEPQALTATRENVSLNGLDGRILVGLPEALDDSRYDLVLANILARPLIELEETFAQRQAAGAMIVLSGILESQIDAIEQHYSRHYEGFERRLLEGWGLLTGRRNEYYH